MANRNYWPFFSCSKCWRGYQLATNISHVCDPAHVAQVIAERERLASLTPEQELAEWRAGLVENGLIDAGNGESWSAETLWLGSEIVSVTITNANADRPIASIPVCLVDLDDADQPQIVEG